MKKKWHHAGGACRPLGSKENMKDAKENIQNSIRRLIPVVLGLAVIMLPVLAPGETFMVKDGKPQAEIIISDKPARMTRLAAAELQAYVEKISGTKLAVTNIPGESMPVKIYVGKSKYTDDLKLSTDGLAHGAFRMASGKDYLALLGPDKDYVPVEPWGRSRQAGEQERVNREWDKITGETFYNPFGSLFMYYNPEMDFWAFDNRGSLHAVYEYLRGLGVRWYMPGDLGEIVPKQTTLVLPVVDRTVRPDFAVRKLVWYKGHLPVSRTDALWRLRLGLDEGHDVVGITQNCHGMKFVHRRKEMKEARPEYYAIWNGKRATDHKDSGAPCLSSPELFKLHVKYARAVFDHFGEQMISIDPVDGYSAKLCECELCKGKGTPERGAVGAMSDYVWGYMNRVATELYKSHPDRFVSGISYGAYRLPPEKIDKLSPNMVIRIFAIRKNYYDPEQRSEFDNLLKAWLEKLPSQKVITSDNISFNGPDSRLPVYYPRSVVGSLRSLKGISMGETPECYEHDPGSGYKWNSQAVAHLTLYVTSRFWWDTTQDLDTMLNEYYKLFYGPAEKEMKAFVEYSEQNWPEMGKDPARIGKALELLDAVQKTADPESVYGRRIRLVTDYVKPMYDLKEQLGRKRENVPKYRLFAAPALAAKKLDGRIDDQKYWQETNTGLRDAETGKSPPKCQGTQFRAHWADKSLCFGIRCSEPDMNGLNLGSPDKGVAGIRDGDFVEILLETSTHSYYRITVNPAGVIENADCHDGANTNWNSHAQAAVFKGDDFWSAEVRIPMAGEGARILNPMAGVDGRKPGITYPWYFNVCRQRARGGIVQRFAFSPTLTNTFEVPGKFAEMWSKK